MRGNATKLVFYSQSPVIRCYLSFESGDWRHSSTTGHMHKQLHVLYLYLKKVTMAVTLLGATGAQDVRNPGEATPQFWTPTAAPTNCRPEAPWGGGSRRGGGLGKQGVLGGDGFGRGTGEGGSRGGGGVGHLRTVGYAAQV